MDTHPRLEALLKKGSPWITSGDFRRLPERSAPGRGPIAQCVPSLEETRDWGNGREGLGTTHQAKGGSKDKEAEFIRAWKARGKVYPVNFGGPGGPEGELSP